MSIGYRQDVDGLRAVAVIPVILFHAGISAFSGGFVGVDIFFVISGFLITSILLKDIARDEFSLTVFYERRIKRIVPALTFVLLCSLIVAWFVMLPDEFNDFGRSLFAVGLFFSNYHFMFNAGYFTAPAENAPLLHTWSLAVEEQYYIVFPIYLFLISRRPAWRAPVTVALFVVSFVYSIYVVTRTPDVGFYSAPARTWELLAGSLLAIYGGSLRFGKTSASALGLAGLAMILFAIFTYTEETAFPGLGAVLPVLGASLLIATGATPGALGARMLALPLLTFIGLISYSLYLWHWPVLVFFRLYAMHGPDAGEVALLLAFVAAASIFSWRYVERPFRKKGIPTRKVLVTGVAVLGTFIVCGVTLALKNGFPERMSDEVLTQLSAIEDAPDMAGCDVGDASDEENPYFCRLGNTNAPATVLFWGDSHAEALLPAMLAAATDTGGSGYAVSRNGCPPLIGVNQIRAGFTTCDKSAQELLQLLEQRPEIQHVVLVSRWAIYATGERFRGEQGAPVFITDPQSQGFSFAGNAVVFERALRNTVSELQKLHVKVTIVGQVPETEWNVPQTLARATQLGKPIELRTRREDYETRQAPVIAVFEALKADAPSVDFLSPEPLLCPDEFCIVEKHGIPIYRDSNHLTASFAKTLRVLFTPLFCQPQHSSRAISLSAAAGIPSGCRRSG